MVLPERAVTRSPRRPDDRRVDPLLGVREKRRGKRPGDAYVRIFRPFEDGFRRGNEEGELIATERTVLGLAEFVPRHWWEYLLHNQTALRLKLRLFVRRNTIVADVPYHPPRA